MSSTHWTAFALCSVLTVLVLALVRAQCRDDEDAKWRRIKRDYRKQMGRK